LKERKDNSPLVNEKIRADRIQLITHDGQNLGLVSRGEALRAAEVAGLDLVVITEEGPDGYPIAKVMDFGKALYAKKKKQTEAKKHQKVIQVKEVKIRPKIGEHDFQTKIAQAVQFLEDGKRLKVTLFFKGRECLTREERGAELFEKINKVFEEHDLVKNLVQEPDTKMGPAWSRVYYLKSK